MKAERFAFDPSLLFYSATNYERFNETSIGRVVRIRNDRVVVYAVRHLAQDVLTSVHFRSAVFSWQYQTLLAA